MPLQRGKYPATNESWIREGQQPQPTRFSIDRLIAIADTAAALVTQVMTSVLIPVQAGDVITRVAFKIGGTAAGTPTNSWVALYSNAATPALLGQSTDLLTAAIAADTWYDAALTTAGTGIVLPYTVPSDGFVYAALMVKATTVPSLVTTTAGRANVVGGVGQLGGAGKVQPALAVTSGAALVGTAPTTIASPTAATTVPYAAIH